MKEKEKRSSNEVWDCGSPLYDSYELACLSHVIDRHMMMLPSLAASKSRKLKEEEEEEMVMIADAGSPGLSDLSSNSSPKELIKKKKRRGGGEGTSCIGVSFLWSNWRRKRICDHDDLNGIEGEVVKKGKKVMKFSDGISRVYNRISSLRK
ncbi:OLC1v1038418C1 [Oldenlandia corymbosa var. corymbosa]|uniref:OLC1v1038418C1 n=1 Tax=Oldenlandia corymbosa var. corymbosa TaxID=529605 RepID=A0AAV1CZX1_OLDCO|nr:OLC1v1038418C1 [Oldenlandia corymbosa var. corymbosa]